MTGRSAICLVGLDIGTQSVRALLADTKGRTLACVRRSTPSRRVGQDSAEYDPNALWDCVLDLLRELASLVPVGGEIAGISCASLGESCVLVDEHGKALAAAMAWSDRRTEPDGRHVAEVVGEERLFRITGYPPDPTLSLCKILWHRREQPEIFAKARLILPLSPWIAFRLSGVASIDYSLASRTLCLDVRSRTWSGELLEALELDETLLPPILPSGRPLGPVRADVIESTGLPGRPIVGVGAQDHICGGFAAGVTKPGLFLDSIGTAEALLAAAEHPLLMAVERDLGYVQTTVGADRAFYLIGSGLNRSGGAVEWACRALGHGISRDELIGAAEVVAAGSNGVCFLPHLAYSSAPNPDTASRGAFVGLSDQIDRAAMFRAVLEGIAMEARLISDVLFSLPGVGTPNDIRVIGGGTKNPLLLEIKASVFDRPLTVYDEPDITAVGAALLVAWPPAFGPTWTRLWPSVN